MNLSGKRTEYAILKQNIFLYVFLSLFRNDLNFNPKAVKFYTEGAFFTMWSMMNQILVAVDDFVWGVPLMILIMSGGVLLTVLSLIHI